MVKNFKERLVDVIQEKKSLVCLGFDPDLDAKQFPPHLKEMDKPKLEMGKILIDRLSDLVPIMKINTRFFSTHPSDYECDQLWELVKYAQKKGLLVIGDDKENDIGSTMAQGYKNQFKFDFDAITVNGYFGSDGIFNDGIFDKYYNEGKGLFVLVKTSNGSSKEFQDVQFLDNEGQMLVTDDDDDLFFKNDLKNYHLMANLVETWSKKYDHVIGGVVGATDLKDLKGKVVKTASQMVNEISTLMEGVLLLPGYGAQGGSADALDNLREGRYCIVNSSRGIMYAYDRRFKGKYTVDNFEEASLAEVLYMNEDLNKHFKGFNA